MHSTTTFQGIYCPDRIAFALTVPNGTRTTFTTTGETAVAIGERYWHSSDGELYRVTDHDADTVEAVVEFGRGDIPRSETFTREWFTPDGHDLHHVKPRSA